jgi:two-component system, chemotaxis family, sensor kinase CheA
MSQDDDLEAVRQIFLEECAENVDLLERGLLELDSDAGDGSRLNDIFRAAHSIKGGAATFGFSELCAFTHHMETLLDQMRSGARPASVELVQLLLGCVDVLRGMLDHARGGPAVDPGVRAGKESALEHAAAALPGAPVAPGVPAAAPRAASRRWTIDFAPKPALLSKGNDPVLILRELGRLGRVEIRARTDELPPLADLTPETCYLSWLVQMETDATLDQLREVFEWVELDCDLEIREVVADPPAAARATGAGAPAPPAGQGSAGEPAIAAAAARAPAAADGGSIRVATRKIDQLINLVGELVITQSMLARFGAGCDASDLDALRDGLAQLDRNTRDLQESVMQVRMLPVSFVFGRFPRLVRDLCDKLGKQVELELEGGHTEVDKTVLERIADPLVHLVRNALDHGIEAPAERAAAGKPGAGRLRLRAYHESGNVVIEIGDDGNGLDRERIVRKAVDRGLVRAGDALTDEQVHELIFAPGFSTAEVVTDLSGRGVGMDVVRKNIHDLGGRVALRSHAGAGTTIEIRLPLTLAIIDGQLVRVGDQVLVVPLLSIVETVQIKNGTVMALPDGSRLCRFRGEYLPVAHLARCLFGRAGAEELLVVAEAQGLRIGLVVDELLGQQQVVIKNLETNYGPVRGVAGATIMGDGSVALILDVGACDALAQNEAAAARRVA